MSAEGMQEGSGLIGTPAERTIPMTTERSDEDGRAVEREVSSGD